jgi:hypothetical protein
LILVGVLVVNEREGVEGVAWRAREKRVW